MTLLRPLPWTIAVIAVLLPVKLALLLEAGVPGLGLGQSVIPQAQAAERGAAERGPAERGAKPAEDSAKPADQRVQPVPAGPSTPLPAPPVVAAPAEPAIPSAERAVLLELRDRRAVLDVREQALASKEALMAATERRMQERLDQLAALQTRLEELDGSRRDHDAANWRGIVKTYESMRPRDAAAILNDMEEGVLLQVLDRMKESKAAPILAAMMPDRARTATAQLAQLRSKQVAAPTGVTPAAISSTPGQTPGQLPSQPPSQLQGPRG